MAKRVDTHTKALYTEAIRQNIAKKDWSKLSEVMIGAELAKVGKPLRRRGWYQVGLFEAERGNHAAAIMAFNSARILDPQPGAIVGRIFEEAEAFCGDFDGRFSRQDLLMLGQALQRIQAFHLTHTKVPTDVLEKGRRVVRWIESRITDAPLREETPATHHVQRIYAALYPPMTIEEVRAEFARIVEPLIRERLERKAKPASGGGAKGPKDPDDEDKIPPEEEPQPGEEPQEKRGKN